ncbi:MAG: radical SAM protein [Desulfobacteraceae bacterium]|jgi:MoaA/NifB/PqqE/SkfB family radical SAM enzyme
MEYYLKNDLHTELLSLKKEIQKKWSVPDKPATASTITANEMVEKAWSVVNELKAKPYLSGKNISDQYGISRDGLAVIYKMIQRSKACQTFFTESKNRDYFNVVNHYFNHQQYTLVFFVGTTCPSRCIYCPNVKIDKQGRRRLVGDGKGKKTPLNEDVLENVFEDLNIMKKKGSDILVKISGGLEPLTDIITMSSIIHQAKKIGAPVKLFTNGLLFSDSLRRTAALQTNDVRINLSTPDENQYQEICFSNSDDRKGEALPELKKNIRKLVEERDKAQSSCKIGFNSIILPSNHTQLIPLLEMARELGVDYVDFKPDYFSTYKPEVVEHMEDSIREARIVASHDSYKSLFVNFTCSLSRNDLFWNDWEGTCNALRQSEFKMFITPFGDCSPVQYGAFPHSTRSFKGTIDSYSIGEIGPNKSLLDVLRDPSKTPEIEMKKLNPYELMLNLEINREEEDKAWGLPICVSPYRSKEKNKNPADLFFRLNITK